MQSTILAISSEVKQQEREAEQQFLSSMKLRIS
jgi:hypothetical protein